MLSGWSPDIVEQRVEEILHGTDKERTRGAYYLLNMRAFFLLSRTVRELFFAAVSDY